MRQSPFETLLINHLLIIILVVQSFNCASVDLNLNKVRTKRDSYLSAYKLTHDLNDHLVDHSPSSTIVDESKVTYVDATHNDEHQHPIYVHNHLDNEFVDHHDNFDIINAHHAEHADHIDVEHQYVPEVYEYQQEQQQQQQESHNGLGLGNYGPSVSSYGPPASGVPSPGSGTYGPPIPNSYYRKPAPVYGPPKPVYVPPTLSPVYLPHQQHQGIGVGLYGPPLHKPPQTYNYYEQEPHSHSLSYMPDFLQEFLSPHFLLALFDKIKLFKIDLFTIGKLILKFFIFKKIMSFLTILFLLLVIPAFKHKAKENVGLMSSMVDNIGADEGDDDEEDDEERSKNRRFKTSRHLNFKHLNSVAKHVLASIESFERKYLFDDNRDNRDNLSDNRNATIASFNANSTLCNRNNGNETASASIYCKSQSVVEKIKHIRDAFVLSDVNGDNTTTTKNTS